MNKLQIAATGYPGTNKSWRFLYATFAQPLQALAKLCGDNTILYGCNVTGTSVSDGWVALQGELFYFTAGQLTQGNATLVTINETIEQAAYNTDLNDDTFFDTLNTYFERVVTLNTGQTTICTFADLRRLNTIAELTTSVTQLQNFAAIAQPIGAIQLWSGAATVIPIGWALCDGTNATPDLRDRFVVGAGSAYAVGDAGGLDEVILSEAQMPTHNHNGATSTNGNHIHSGSTNASGNHRHNYSKSVRGRGYDTRNDDNPHGAYQNAYTGYSGNHSHSLNIVQNGDHSHTVTTEDKGNNQPHENRPPYYALCYIMFKGIE